MCRLRGREMKGIKGILAIGIASMALLIGARGLAEDAQLTRGLDWLQSQVQSNGTLVSERDSLAVVEQVRTEAAHTLAQGGRTSALPDLSPSDISDVSTELLARRIVGLGATGRTEDAADVLAVLVERANANGGYGGAVGQPSNPLDTSLSLLAMRSGGLVRDARVQAAVSYLSNAAGADGSYNLGQTTYTTAYALQAFARYRNDYSIGPVIQRTRAALIAQQVGGAYGDPVSNAVAIIALAQSGPASDAAAAVTALRSAQQSDGSWGSDPYVTALAVRALLVASDAPSTEPGRIAGEVYDANSGLPIAQAQIVLSGASNTAVSNANGTFVLENVPAGQYPIIVSHAGYADRTGNVVVEGGSTSQLGRILLMLADDTAALRGTVTDSETAMPLAGAMVEVTGELDTQTQTNAQGAYELLGLPAGSYSIRVSHTGYQSLTQVADLPARTAVSFSPALTPEGEEPPTTASANGIVVNADDGSPIEGATVSVNGSTAVTGADGLFVIDQLTAGPFDGSAQATDYDSVSFSGVLANGQNNLGRIPLSESSDRRTLIGTVTSSATGEPIANATLTLNGAPAGQSDGAGQYRIEDTASAYVELTFDAVGYQSRTATTRLENPGIYRIDAALEDLREGSFQVLNMGVAPAAVLPGDRMRISADIANLEQEAKPALVLVRLLDSTGAKVAQFCGAETIGLPEQCEYAFDAAQTKPFVVEWTATNLPAGRYKLAIHVVEPGSIQRDAPLGLVYGSASRDIEIRSSLGLQGSVTPSSPVMIPGSTAGVDFTATVQNRGNDIIPAGEARLNVTDRTDGSVAHTVTVALPELLPSAIVELDFGNWQPGVDGAQYDLQVVATNPAVAGSATGEFYIGSAASAEFTVTPTETADGTQRVEAALTVTGVDHTTGEGSDPLFGLVREAVTRGGGYTAVNAPNWQRSNQCLGCHIQTQSLYGLGSSIDKAEIDEAAALFLQNSQSASVQSDRAIYQAHPEYRRTSSMLGLWSMKAWPDRRATFNARYRVADYLYGRRTVQGTGVYWSRDHDTGWLVENPAASATVVEGIASVLHDAEAFGISQIREYRAVQRGTSPAQLVDLAAATDGRVYTLQADGKIYVFNPADQTLTLFATARLGTSYTGIAVDSNGTVYVTSTPKSGQSPVVERVSEVDNVAVATLPVYANAIDTTHDQRIAVLSRSERSIYLVDPAGTNQRIAIGGLIPTTSTTLTAAPDGSLLVTSNASSFEGAIRIARDGTQSRAYAGGLYPLRDLAFGSDGQVFAGGGDAIYEISAEGVIERYTGTAGRHRLAVANGKVYALNASATTQLAELEPTSVDIAPRLAEMREAVQQAARFFETYANYGIPAEAFRLLLLSEARPYLSDPALIGRVDARIPELTEALRAAQRADGGWSRYSGQASDPLVTAIVGTALDYTNPLPTDPVLRKSVQYLLSTQSSEGSWSGHYFSTRLGATSYVMAYLPKAVARLGGIDVGLGLEFDSNVRLVDSSVAPDSSQIGADGSSSYMFNLGRVGAAGATFVFTLDLIAMQIDEWRQIAKRAFLRFINSFNGETVEAPIAIPTVHASSKYQLSLTLSRALLRANEDLIVEPTVRNGGSSYTSGSVRYFIETTEGAPIAELPVVGFTDLAIGDERALPQPWNTGLTTAGDYRARVVLMSPDGQVLGEASQPFTIETTSTGPQLSSSVATDRPVYDPLDTVQVLGKVRNLTLNSRYEQLTVTETVTMPDGQQLWTDARAIEVLDANTTVSANFTLNLVSAPAGTYTVTQVVTASSGQELDTKTTSFQVRSTTVGGAGLSGTIAAVPEEVDAGAATSFLVNVRNEGNADLDGVPLIVSVVDPQGETVIASWTQAQSVSMGQSVSYSQPWATVGVMPGAYQVVLQARFGDELVTLAHGPVRVVEPPIDAEMSQSVAATGRVLVLISCHDHGGCNVKGHDHGHGDDDDDGDHGHDDCAHERAAFLADLLTRIGISHKIVTTGQDFVREYATGRYDMYWVSGGAEKLPNTFAEELREAVYQGDGMFVEGSHDSRNQILNDALGVKFQGHLSGNRHQAVTLDEFDVGRFDASGDAVRYSALTAQVRGRFDTANGPPAFFINQYGLGRSVAAGFDFLPALIDSDSATQAEDLLLRTLTHVKPIAPTYGLAGGYLKVDTQVRNLAQPAEFVLRSEAVSPLSVEDAAPQPESMSPDAAQWRFQLPVSESRAFSIGLRLPGTSGAYVLNSTLRVSSASEALRSNQLSLTVASPAQLVEVLQQDLDALPLTQSSERNARNKAKTYVAQALSAMRSGRRDSAVGYLLKAIEELAKIRSVSTVDCHEQMSTLVKAARVAAVQ